MPCYNLGKEGVKEFSFGRNDRANEPGDKIVLYTGLEKSDVDRLAGKMNMVLVWNMPAD